MSRIKQPQAVCNCIHICANRFHKLQPYVQDMTGQLNTMEMLWYTSM